MGNSNNKYKRYVTIHYKHVKMLILDRVGNIENILMNEVDSRYNVTKNNDHFKIKTLDYNNDLCIISIYLKEKELDDTYDITLCITDRVFIIKRSKYTESVNIKITDMILYRLLLRNMNICIDNNNFKYDQDCSKCEIKYIHMNILEGNTKDNYVYTGVLIRLLSSMDIKISVNKKIETKTGHKYVLEIIDRIPDIYDGKILKIILGKKISEEDKNEIDILIGNYLYANNSILNKVEKINVTLNILYNFGEYSLFKIVYGI